jgi:hypothetical protein
MKMKKKKVRKEAWEKPKMVRFPFKNTYGGTTQEPYVEATGGPTYS